MSAIMIVSNNAGFEPASRFVNEHFGLTLDDVRAHPDVWLCNSGDIKNNTIKIAVVKELTNFMATKPVYLPYKLIVLTYFESATKEAQNAMLKLLEDSPVHVHFVLVTSTPQRVLPTILSRVQVIHDTYVNQAKGVYYDIADKLLEGALSDLLARDYSDIDINILFQTLRRRLRDLNLSSSQNQQVYDALINAHRYNSVYLPSKDIIIYLAAMFKKILGVKFNQ